MSDQGSPQSEANQDVGQNSNNSMEQLYQEVIKKRSLIIVEENQLLPLLDYCLEYKQQCLEEERYLAARDANELAESIKKELQYRQEDQDGEQSTTSEVSTETTKKYQSMFFYKKKKKN